MQHVDIRLAVTEHVRSARPPEKGMYSVNSGRWLLAWRVWNAVRTVLHLSVNDR